MTRSSNTLWSKSFQDHFTQHKNHVYKCGHFNQQTQQLGETTDSFVIAFHSLAEHCVYNKLCKTMIYDCLIEGLLDASLSERMQLEPDLTLQDAIKCARNSSLVKQQQATARSLESILKAKVAVDATCHSHSHHKQFCTNSLVKQGANATKKQQFGHLVPTPRRG